MQQQQQAGPPIDLKNTSEVKNFEGDVSQSRSWNW